MLDQRGVVDRSLAEGKAMQVQAFAGVPMDISDFPTRHNYGLALRQSHFERILAGWLDELGVPILRERGVTGFTQDDSGIDFAGCELLPGAYVERTVIGKKIELYRWLAEPHWERASRRLEALSREVMGLLARAYCDAGQHADALAMYARVFADDPLDRGAHEGLLVAAAGTGDAAQLHEAWQQICVCLGGDGDLETRSLYERLMRELERTSNTDRTGTAVAAGSGFR